MRTTLALACFLLALGLTRPALADVTLTGTVGEVGGLYVQALNLWVIRFNLTDPNQTASCVDQVGTGAKYAYIKTVTQQGGTVDWLYREWYAMLLVSKKGATITCTVEDAKNCHVTSCTLP